MSESKLECREYLGSFIEEVHLNGDSTENLDIYGGESIVSRKDKATDQSMDLTSHRELSKCEKDKKHWIGG